MSTIKLLGTKYFSLDSAIIDASPSEVIVSKDGEEAYYIITPDLLTEELIQLGYKVVKTEG
ncbi:hypothetical protein [Bacillus weihaiensis]|uniref:Uncharacterized protein n=1 Tax=Bacillus weihaiensis TaxID=1547283 RepID=A0A1L3MQP4_9BACI|nr:hypothetical protein [Bacillus weihaiensis]APH04656.1 hypothetical protein A9C19_07795 [Bacillus weihaiensis]